VARSRARCRSDRRGISKDSRLLSSTVDTASSAPHAASASDFSSKGRSSTAIQPWPRGFISIVASYGWLNGRSHSGEREAPRAGSAGPGEGTTDL